MKTLVFSITTIALLRATSAYFSSQVGLDHHEQLVHQPAQYQELIKTLASSEDFVEVPLEEPINAASDPFPEHRPQLPGTSSPPSQFHVGNHGSQWAMVYHPYNSDGTCSNQATVHSHLATIAAKGFTAIRLHNHDCNILPKLSSSPLVISHKIKLILGIHIDEGGIAEAAPHVGDIIAWASEPQEQATPEQPPWMLSTYAATSWSFVELVVVGEESIFNNHLTSKELASFIADTRAQLRRAGYTGPVTTTEPIHVLYDSAPILCPHLDVLASNIHPFFHAEVSAGTAGDFVEETLGLLETAVCTDGAASRPAVNLETGWPWRGRANGKAVPGREEQVVALEEILSRTGGRSVVLGFGDDGWMEEGEFGVEGSWGCESIFPESD